MKSHIILTYCNFKHETCKIDKKKKHQIEEKPYHNVNPVSCFHYLLRFLFIYNLFACFFCVMSVLWCVFFFSSILQVKREFLIINHRCRVICALAYVDGIGMQHNIIINTAKSL